MKAIVVRNPGGPEVLEATADWDDPSPGAGEVVVDVSASGVNFIDVYHRTGRYPVEFPLVPGAEGAGTVSALGEGVTEFRVGDAVTWASAPGSYAQRVAVPVSQLIPVPEGVPHEQAAAAMLQGLTAHYLTHTVHAVRPGDDVLVHAAAGGVGLLLTQMVKLLGGRVIATVSTDDKERLARDAGADEVLRYEGFAEAVRDLTDGAGVHVVYDGVGKTTFDDSLASLRVRGMMALYGGASGPVPPFDPMRLSLGGSLSLCRPTLAHYVGSRAELLSRSADLLGWIGEGKLSVHIGHRFDLTDAKTAHEELEGRRTTGKVLLIP